MRVTLLCAFLLLSTFGGIDGAVYRGDLYIQMVNGKYDIFCKYDELKLKLDEEHIDNANCIKCTCSGSGLNCEDLVFRITAPKHSKCISVTKNCQNHWVLRNDTNKDCPSDLVPEVISAVGK